MGALKFTVIGRIGMQPAWAFSRSQLISAVNGWRTRKSMRRTCVLVIPLAIATPRSQTSETSVPGVKRR